MRNCRKILGFRIDRTNFEYLTGFNFRLPLIYAPFSFRHFIFRPLDQKSHISSPLIFAPFQTDKHFSTKFTNSLLLYFATLNFKGLKNSLPPIFAPLEAKIKGRRNLKAIRY